MFCKFTITESEKMKRDYNNRYKIFLSIEGVLAPEANDRAIGVFKNETVVRF